MAIWHLIEGDAYIGTNYVDPRNADHSGRTWTPNVQVKAGKVDVIDPGKFLHRESPSFGSFSVEHNGDTLRIHHVTLASGLSAMIHGFPLLLMPRDPQHEVYWNNNLGDVPTKVGEIALSFRDLGNTLIVVACLAELAKKQDVITFGPGSRKSKHPITS